MPRSALLTSFLVVLLALSAPAWSGPITPPTIGAGDIQTAERQVLVPARPSDATPHPDSAVTARDWASMLIALADAKDWGPAMWVAPIGVQSFAHEAIWSTPALQRAWRATLVAKAQQGWSVGTGGTSLWRLADGADPLRPSLGLVRQNDGSWWVVIAEADSVDGVPTVPWSCPAAGCPASLDVLVPPAAGLLASTWALSEAWPSTANSVTLRHPDGRQLTASTRVLGFPLRPSLASTQVSRWSLTMPGGTTPSRWDMSFLSEICAVKGLSCPGPLAGAP